MGVALSLGVGRCTLGYHFRPLEAGVRLIVVSEESAGNEMPVFVNVFKNARLALDRQGGADTDGHTSNRSHDLCWMVFVNWVSMV